MMYSSLSRFPAAKSFIAWLKISLPKGTVMVSVKSFKWATAEKDTETFCPFLMFENVFWKPYGLGAALETPRVTVEL